MSGYTVIDVQTTGLYPQRHERIHIAGGKEAREVAEQTKIDDLGGVRGLINVVNPIGQKRLDLMPQPYSR